MPGAEPPTRIVHSSGVNHFHRVALANNAVTQGPATGYRRQHRQAGTAKDPIGGKRNRLLRGDERLSAEWFTKM